MSDAVSLATMSPPELKDSLTTHLLTGAASGAGVASGSDLGAAIAVDGVKGKAGGDGLSLSSLLTEMGNAAALRDAIAGAILGGNANSNALSALAGLGATLNAMAAVAQMALTSDSATARANALSEFQGLYYSLDKAAVAIDGAAGNARSLGVTAPGDWTNPDPAAGKTTITADMTNVVKAHMVVQEMIPSVATTLLAQSLALGA